MKKNDFIICVDFHGTLKQHGNESPVLGAVQAMRHFASKGYVVIIWTSTPDYDSHSVMKWLYDWDIPCTSYNEYPASLVRDNLFWSRKLDADIYIDNNQVGGLPSWGDIQWLVDEKYQELNLDYGKKIHDSDTI